VGEPSILTIEDATDQIIDYRGKTPPKSASGVRLVTAKVIKDGRILDAPQEFISTDFYDEWMRRGLPRPLDVLLTTEGPLGEVAILRGDAKIALAQRVILLRARQGRVDPEYLFYALQSEFAQSELAARSSGTTVAGIKQSELRQVKIPVWPLSVQRRIARILAAYDNLIENNERREQILEQMARAIYYEWFVEFRFSDHERKRRVTSPVTRIPEGWKVKRLREVCEINRDQISPASAPKEVHYIDISSVSPGKIHTMTTYGFEDAPGRARRVVRHGDIIWSCVRPNRRSHALVIQPRANTVASTGFAVLTATDVPFTYLYFATTTDEFVAFLTNNATGAAYPAVSAKTFENAKLLIPDASLLEEFGNATIPFAEQIHVLRCQSQVLRVTRDLLLSRLLSGQITPDEAAA
jgi:type I restriction enzyme, S subunit